MKILIASSEVTPYAKTGGLADVAAALPKALAGLRHDVRVVMPLYGSIDPAENHLLPVMRELDVFLGSHQFRCQVFRATLPDTQVPIYFIQCPPLFGRAGLYGEDGEDYPDNPLRFAFASLAIIWMLKGLDWAPDIIQANDWQTALIPTYLRNWPILSSDPFFSKVKVLYTVHNLAYQGLADPSVLPELGLDWSLFTPDLLEFYDQVNFMKAGLVCANHISTVSKTYAKEIQTQEFGCGLSGVISRRSDSLSGILNGIDTEVWDPERDPLIPSRYGAQDLAGKADCKAVLQRHCGLEENPTLPLIGIISRLAQQKGLDLVVESISEMMSLGVQLVILGTGDPTLEKRLTEVAKAYPKRISVNLRFDEEMAHRIEAGADMFLMPSRFEPCGLNQLYSLRYGTIPIVRKTGGLADSIVDATDSTLEKKKATGFAFTQSASAQMLEAIGRAVALFKSKSVWGGVIQTAMAQDFSWKASAKAYDRLFKRMTET